MAYEFELPVNFEAERIVIGTLINSNRLVYGGKMIDCGIVYIDKNWFFGSFYQDVFTVVKIFRKEDKDLNKMDILNTWWNMIWAMLRIFIKASMRLLNSVPEKKNSGTL